MSDPHHTPEEIAAAFAVAPKILNCLIENGIKHPRFELFADASGLLVLGFEQEYTAEQIELASKMVFSNRGTHHRGRIAIMFCCGLVEAAKYWPTLEFKSDQKEESAHV